MFAKAAYVYLLRVPIVVGLVLFLFPIAAIYSPLHALFENLFDIDGVGTFLTTVLALITAWGILLTSRLILVNGASRFGTASVVRVSELSARTTWWVLVAMPALFAQFTRLSHFARRNKAGDPCGLVGLAAGHTVMIVVGACAAYVLAYVGILLAVLFAPTGTRHDTAKAFPACPFMREWLEDADKKILWALYGRVWAPSCWLI